MIRKFILHWKNIVGGILMLVCLLGLIVLMGFIGRKSRDYACKDVKVIIPGEQSFIARADIDQILKEHYGELVGKTLSAIPIHQIEQDLKNIPFIEEAQVTADMDGTLTIRIDQRTALLRVINTNGEHYYIDINGLKMPLSPYYTPRVLVANGYITESFKSLDSIRSSLVNDLYETAVFVTADTLWNSQIEQLYVNNIGDIELVPRVGNQTIVLGNADSLQRKFDKLYLFYKQVIPAVGWDYYHTVKLNFAKQLVCEKNEKFINNKPDNIQ